MTSGRKTVITTVHPLWFYGFALGPVLIWAVNMVVTRYAAGVIEPVSISFWRLLIALLLLSAFLWLKIYQHATLLKQSMLPCAVLASLGMVGYQCLSYWAAHSTTATNMSMINALIPIFTILISMFLLAEKPSLYAICGSILSLFGLLFFIAKGSLSMLWQGGWHLGDGLMLIAVAAYALYGVLVRYWNLNLPILLSVWLQTLFAIILHLPLLAFFGLQPLDSNNFLPVLYAALLPSILAPLLWMQAMQTIGPNRASIFTHLGPIITAWIAYFYLNEQWFYYHTIGAILAMLGVMLSQRQK